MAYPSDLTKAQFEEIEIYLPVKKRTKPLKWNKHQIINGILYSIYDQITTILFLYPYHRGRP